MSVRIIFDLDGTIIDSAKSLSIVANKILENLGRSFVDEEKYKTFIGDGLRKQVERLLIWSGGIPSEGLDHYYKKFLEIYNEDPTSNLVPFPHVLDCIALLSKRNAKLAICTQKLTKPSIKILKKLNIYNYFDQFAFGDTLRVRKPDPRMINYIIQNDQPETSTVYVGDSEVDSETAKNAKVRFILFSKGYRKSSIEEIKPDFSFSSYENLPRILERSLGEF